MYDLTEFGLTDLIRLSAQLRSITGTSLEEVAGRVIAHLSNELVDADTGRPACVLARLYKTHRFADLPAELQASAPFDVDPDTRCLTLLSSAGDLPEWNDRSMSKHHHVIPLTSHATVTALPMVRALIGQLGLEVAEVVSAEPILLEPMQRGFNVFHVEDAAGSPFVPDQRFVAEHGVRSVLGFGGALPGGEIWAVVLFTRSHVPPEVALLFRGVGLSVGVAMLPINRRTFASEPAQPPVAAAELNRWRAEAMERLLEVREGTVLRQTERLQRTLIELDARARELRESRRTLEASEARKAAIIECALDAIVTIDCQGVIVEFNPAAEALFGYSRDEAVGMPMADLIIPERLRADHRAGLDRYLATGETRILNQHIQITGVRATGEEFPVELTVTRVDLPDGLMFSAYIRDLTEARNNHALLVELADALQRNLLPRGNPVIPGIELSAAYRSAAGEARLVGGDFYDSFPVGDNTWAVSIGDVCGKGPKVVAFTQLVCHFIRSGEQHHGKPDETLREVNRLVREDRHVNEEGRFCTAALVRLTPGPGEARVAVALAGHPQPAVVRCDGRVELVGAPALPLGLFEEFEAEMVDVRLGPGDALVLYTDGVTEARVQGGEVFGEERMVAALVHTAGRPAQEQVDHLMAALVAHAEEPSDDTAVVIIRVPAPADGGAQLSDNG